MKTCLRSSGGRGELVLVSVPLEERTGENIPLVECNILGI